MRATYLKEGFESGSSIDLSPKEYHHLINVVRLNSGEEVLLLDGEGKKGLGRILECSKKRISIECEKTWIEKQSDKSIVLGIGQLKKDAMDSVFRMAPELGVSEIIVLNTERSQQYPLRKDRINKVLISGMEQSNCGHLPRVRFGSLENLVKEDCDSVFVFHLEESDAQASPQLVSGSNLVLIGPEGGFSEQDMDLIGNMTKVQRLHINTPIMRAPTAFACAVGYLKAFC